MMHTRMAGAEGNHGFSLLLDCMLQVIARETEEADKVKSVVSQEEAVASKEAAGVKAIKVLSNSCCTIIAVSDTLPGIIFAITGNGLLAQLGHSLT